MCGTHHKSWPPGVLQLLLMAIFSGCGHSPSDKPAASRPPKETAMPAQMPLLSSAFAHDEAIPRKYTGDGEDKSPPLSWSVVPPGTKELALIVDDPDAPTPTPWVHWVLYRIPAEARNLPEGITPSLRVAQPAGLLQGKNSWGKAGYGGPAPPKGHGRHRYFFKLYALDSPVDLEPGATKEALLKAISGHVQAEGELIGTYQR
jgi:Raf kinase inhibitor-like YbhB/YbcL family protein